MISLLITFILLAVIAAFCIDKSEAGYECIAVIIILILSVWTIFAIYLSGPIIMKFFNGV